MKKQQIKRERKKVSKKTSQKKKVNVKLSSGEAYVVADFSIFEHIVSTYNHLGDSEEDRSARDNWYNVASLVLEWAQNTYYNSEVDYEEQDW